MSSHSARPVLVLGDVLIDEMRDPSGSVDVPGGSALNVAVGLAVLGTPALLAGMVGDDDAGRLLRDHLRSHGVPLLATPAPRGTGRAVSDRTDGEPRYSFSAASRSRTLVPTGELRAAAARAELIVVSGFPFDDPAEAATLDALVPAGTPLAIDANPRPGLLHDRDAFAEGLLAAASRAALVKVGAEDAELVFGADLASVTELLLDAGAGAVLETAGAEGAAYVRRGHREAVPVAAAAGPIVDTMGAGDAAFATAVAALVAGAADPLTVLSRAMAVAAATVRAPGGLLRLPA
ncbi:fructokinase [Rathayibacter sp. PhB152]|uniref:PfkB family carbohydrate kinase n=1 Tax=Rathayibacter sp. PhB152 TaxID=2485190 RepID=UPI000F4B883F|nr:PfkB family carbohydrate kinase [Rathayibacter sp. PhB152]ROQ64715.1 fructokinase [Rathayibacter sp. PhB152]